MGTGGIREKVVWFQRKLDVVGDRRVIDSLNVARRGWINQVNLVVVLEAAEIFDYHCHHVRGPTYAISLSMLI